MHGSGESPAQQFGGVNEGVAMWSLLLDRSSVCPVRWDPAGFQPWVRGIGGLGGILTLRVLLE